jgi:ATP-dependent Clp protease ATP-binding subunit ClpC
LELSVKIGIRSLPGRNFPDKAIDLIDEAASRVRLNDSLGLPVAMDDEGTPLVSREDIESVVDSWGGVYVDDKDDSKLFGLETELKKRVIGQEEAVEALASALRRSRVGLGGRTRVSASFLFAGSSGVGKTHLAKALAEVLFGSERSLIRFDMSEFQEPHSISKLIGAPPGYVGYEQGGRLTEAVRRQPFSVVLLDEIEKSHPDIYNTFLQVLDEGRLTDGLGRTVDFRRVILIMTSNTGFNVGPGIGFTNQDVDTESPLKALFTPEFLDRLDEVIRFRPLVEPELVQITQILLQDIARELQTRERTVHFDPALANWIVQKAPKTGSTRILRNLIREHIEDPLSLELLTKPGRVIIVTLRGSEVAFEEEEVSLV